MNVQTHKTKKIRTCGFDVKTCNNDSFLFTLLEYQQNKLIVHSIGTIENGWQEIG